MKSIKILSLSLLLMFGLAGQAFANVSLKNGNFFMSYTDIIYPGGFEPKMERIYNSKSAFKGMYGWGWGNEFDVYMAIAADGTIVVHEYGGGAQNVFTPEEFDKDALEAAVNAIASAAQETKAVNSPAEVARYGEKLRNDSLFRNQEWEKFKALKLVAARDLPVGTVLRSNKFSYQIIRRMRDGYLRVYDNGRTEHFNDAGRLTRNTDKNNNYIDLSYDEEGRLQSITDNLARKMTFTFTSRGFLEKLVGDKGREALYRYNDKDELVYSKDVDGNVYEYQYDSSNRHNLTKIIYADKTSLDITYYSYDLKENVRSVKDRDGTLTSYSYVPDPNDQGHLKIAVTVFGSDGKEFSKSSYEYFTKRDERGTAWTQRMITDLDGDITDTTYQHVTGLPLSIKRNNEETRFEYDEKGHVTRKETSTEIVELKYHPRVDKVMYVKTTSKLNPKQSSWAKFDYDASANLVHAENSEKKTVDLKYDEHGRISAMIDKDQTRIEFTYNADSKPIEIWRIIGKDRQSITVKYTAAGEVEKVESSSGRSVATSVTNAFQSLLDLIRPAGVNLSF